MKAFRVLSAIVILLLVVGLFPPQQVALAQPAVPQQDDPRGTAYVPGEVLVSFERGMTARAYEARAGALAGVVGGEVVRQVDNLALLSFSPNADVPALVNQLRATSGVHSAQPNFIYWIPEIAGDALAEPVQTEGYTVGTGDRQVTLNWDQVLNMRSKRKTRIMSTFPNEISYNWGWDRIQADLIWPDTTASPTVCVLDTGADIAHGDLSGNVLNGYDFFNMDAVPNDDNGHGTHVAGIISAKMNNGTKTAVGVSNGKVLAVKVLSAQGYGNSMTIAAGIRYCANNSSVKVINMSLGAYTLSPLDAKLEYEALYYAIKNKGKLVAAAAGNDSTSNRVYPAAWADPLELTPIDAVDSNDDPILDNTEVAKGLMSVAASAAPGIPTWVDINNDGLITPDEIFNRDDCASWFSNYGSWVDIVAPGESIYSTTPTSYPFYLKSYMGYPSSYAWMSGTSMATPFVAGAAARVWGVLGTTKKYDYIKSWLLYTGDPLKFAADGDAGLDPVIGYANTGFTPPTYIDDPVYGTVMQAPYCWPNVNGAFIDEQDMSDDANGGLNPAVYLNVAAAMGRGALVAQVTDAQTGQPLIGANVQAVQVLGSTSTVVRDTATLTAKSSNPKYPYVVLINLPTNVLNPTPYRLLVSATGYTNGYQHFNTVALQRRTNLTAGNAGQELLDPGSNVGVPANNGKIHVVLTWDPVSKTDLDMYLFMPQGFDFGDGIGGAAVGPGLLATYQPNFTRLEIPVGTLIDKLTLPYSPNAQRNFDGSPESVNMESFTINAATSDKPPYLRPRYITPGYDPYAFLVTDYSVNYTGLDCTLPENAAAPGCHLPSLFGTDPTDIDPKIAITADSPRVRVWAKGVLYKSYDLTNLDAAGNYIYDPNLCSGMSYDFWYPFKMYSGPANATLFGIPDVYCGDADMNYVLPY